MSVQAFEVRVGEVQGGDGITRMILEWVGNMSGLCAGQQNRDEPRPARFVVVDAVVDERPFPSYALALARLLMAHHAPAIDLGADEQDEVGRVDLIVHPMRPTLPWCRVDILIED